MKTDCENGLRFTGFPDDGKPVLLVIGGSQGAACINAALRACLPELLKQMRIIHLCGKGNLDPSIHYPDEYVQYEYIESELKDLFALADMVLSRAGANAICELLALRKPNLLIPLSAAASRGDQILNARSYEKQGYSMVLEEEQLTPEILPEKCHINVHDTFSLHSEVLCADLRISFFCLWKGLQPASQMI